MSEPAMLSVLRIANLAIVDRVELSFGPGLNVLTGETGAGKSILVDALSLVLGGRGSSEWVRSGAQEAEVEALIELGASEAIRRRFEDRGIAVPEGEVLIRRTISKAGKSRVTINGQLATVGMLSEAARGLIDISGQHEHVSLLDPDGHLDLLDAFGGLLAKRDAVAEAHGEVQGLSSALESVQLDEAEKARREDFLRFQLEELEQIDPKPGEVEALEAERRLLANATRLAEGARRAEDRLYSGDEAIVGVLGRIQLELTQLARMDDRLGALTTQATSALAELEDLSRALGRYTSALEADPARLEEVEDRLEALKKLMKKHGGSIENVLARREELAQELESLTNDEARRADLQSALEAAIEKRAELAGVLTAERAKAARAFEKAVKAELASLSMGSTRLAIELRPRETVGSRGAEGAEFLMSPNPGEPLRPLHKTASGGELSRVLLAVKRVLAEKDQVATYVFDEVDSGIGGAVADVLGKKLREVARDHQVLTITHLPQVAAYAETHFMVRKQVDGGRTVSKVERLDDREAAEEVARMLGGVDITDRTRQLAREMRDRAKKQAAGSPKEELALAVAGAKKKNTKVK